MHKVSCFRILRERVAQVVVAEGAPDYGGHRLARALAEAGIESTAIADSAIFAMMARVNKVGTEAPQDCQKWLFPTLGQPSSLIGFKIGLDSVLSQLGCY